MSSPFRRTISAVETDGNGRTLFLLACTTLILAGAVVWLRLARVNVYVVSDSARLEVDLTAHTVQAAVAGRVVSAAPVRLGDRVAAETALLELDSATATIELESTSAICAARRRSLGAQIATLEAEAQAIELGTRAANAAVGAARTRQQAAASLAGVAAEGKALAETLRHNFLISEQELLNRRATAEEKDGAAHALGSETVVIDAERRVRINERVAALGQRRVLIAELEGQVAECEGKVKRLEHEVDLHTVRAPVSGYVAELHPTTRGEHLASGTSVAAIVPSGAPRVVAEFVPGPSVGRVRPGQAVRLALDAFPWLEHGFVEAVVTSVASEPRGGRIRVECSVNAQATRMKLQHGLPGSAEIVVEQVSPWTLLLRGAGQAVLEPKRAAVERSPPPAPGLER